MARYSLDFANPEEQREFYAALLQGLDRGSQERQQAGVMAQIGDFVAAYGPGRFPYIKYVGGSTFVVALISTRAASPEKRTVERIFVFRDPSSLDIARTVTARIQEIIDDIKCSDHNVRVQLRRKLHHICDVLDPHLEALFGCVAETRAQEVILRRVEDWSDKASADPTVSSASSLLGLSRLLGIFHSTRTVKSANHQ